MINPAKKLKPIFHFVWKIVGISRQIFSNLLFLFFIVLILSLLFLGRDNKVPKGAALVLSPAGTIVEQKTYPGPMPELVNQMFGESVQSETLLRDITDAVDYASKDKRIETIFLDLESMEGAGICKLQDIGKSLNQFKKCGKKIIAFGDNYTQNQYYLASHADEVYLHPFGSVILSGYGIYRLYFKKAIEKLMVQYNTFTVGTYKSAIEPFIRNDMSNEAKKVNTAWLNALWNAYTKNVESLRGLNEGIIDNYINGHPDNIRKVGGDSAKLAIEHGLIDGVRTRDQIRKYLIELVGSDGKNQDFKQIDFKKYLSIVRPAPLQIKTKSEKVAVLTAKGTILSGQQHTGNIGCDSFSELIRQARDDETVKAIVIRIDSGGGSAFASEIIRQEIVAARESGKPIVISMGSVAASGGYWIATMADEIWASPTTITGSIGVISAFPTFEKSLEYIGVNNDGLGTTKMANAFDQTRPINPLLEDSMKQMTQYVYHRFVNLVSIGRNLNIDDVEKIAQGRIWTGKKALEIGLVDHMGGINDAVKSAAKRAGIKEYDVVYMEKDLTLRERLFSQLNVKISNFLKTKNTLSSPPLGTLLETINTISAQFSQMNDPKGVYLKCMTCDIQ